MKRIAFIALTVVTMAFALSSCLVVSLHPLGSNSERIWKQELLGEWDSPSSSIIIKKHPRGAPYSSYQYLIQKTTKTFAEIRPEDRASITGDPKEDSLIWKRRVESAKKVENIPDSIKRMTREHFNHLKDFSPGMSEEQKENKRLNQFLKNASYERLDLFEDTLSFNANLFEVGDSYYFDLSGHNYDPVLENFLPVHTFIKLNFNEDEFEYTELDGDKLADLFEEKRIRLPHETTSDGFTLITANGSKIQEFLKKYTKNSEVFLPSVKYLRK